MAKYRLATSHCCLGVACRSLNETVKTALRKAVDALALIPKFAARVRRIIDEDRELLETSSRTDGEAVLQDAGAHDPEHDALERSAIGGGHRREVIHQTSDPVGRKERLVVDCLGPQCVLTEDSERIVGGSGRGCHERMLMSFEHLGQHTSRTASRSTCFSRWPRIL